MGANLLGANLQRAGVVVLAMGALAGSNLAGLAQPAANPASGTPATEAAPAASGTAPAVNAKEQQLLDRIRQLKAPRWRSYGVCRYDWSTWRLTEGGVRTTDSECGADNSRTVVAVHCDTLQVSRREGEGAWSPWRLPLSASESKTTGGEDLMVAALCANLKPAPEGAAAPAPLKTVPGPGSPATKPATTKPATTKPAAAKPSTTKPAAKPATNAKPANTTKTTGNR